MSRFLETMQAASIERAAALVASAQSDAIQLPGPVELALSKERFDVIAEIKKRSPAEGILSTNADIADHACAYAAGGACAISVLTEPTRFDGSLADLESVAKALAGKNVPILRKDFLVDPLQIYESRLAGASGVLLILKLLDETALPRMLDAAFENDLFVLLEAFDREDLVRLRGLLHHPARILYGINSRDLMTLAVDTARFASLASHFPSGIVRVAESGIESSADAAVCAGLGYSVVLIGSALMRADDPAEKIGQLLSAGRAAARAS